MTTTQETAIARIEPDRNVAIGSVQADGPLGVINTGTIVANEIKRLVSQAGLVKKISGREYVQCEGWTTAAAMLGVTPREVSVTEDIEAGDVIAVVELVRTRDGMVIGRASALLGGDEPVWRNRPRYARRSMAVTRATAKACRLSFSWIMTLAGFMPTPADEVPDNDDAPLAAQPARQNTPRPNGAAAAPKAAPKAAAPTPGTPVTGGDFVDRIHHIEEVKSPANASKPWTRYDVYTCDGGDNKVSTFSTTIKAKAEQALAEEVAVKIVWEDKGRGPAIVDILSAEEVIGEVVGN